LQVYSDMENSEIYKFIESLQEIPYTPVNLISDKAVNGIGEFFKPVAASVNIKLPDRTEYSQTIGEKPELNTIKSYLLKHIEPSVSEAQFILRQQNNMILTIAKSVFPRGYSSSVAVLTNYDDSLKGLISQVISLYTSNISLALAMQNLKQKQKSEIESFLRSRFPEFEVLGVRYLMICKRATPQESKIISRKQISLIRDYIKLSDLLADSKRLNQDELKRRLSEIVSIDLVSENISLNEIEFSGQVYDLFILGSFKNSETVFSKVRDTLGESSNLSGYDEILKAYKNLKKDQELVIKGERIAAILETAVAINHEVNNPLTAIIGNTQLLLLNQEQLAEDVSAKIKTIEKSAMRIREVTKKLMSIVEPITTSYTDGLSMLDIDRSSAVDDADITE